MFRHLAGVALLAVASLAGAQQYAQRSLDIHAGIVLIDSAQPTPGVPGNPTPHVWFNFDLNQSVKPAAWSFTNPTAVTQATAEISARWTALSSVAGIGGGAPAVGDRITKREAAYWEVRLSQLSDAQLAQFDVL